MLKTIFLLKSGRVNRDGESSIILRLSYKNKIITIASGKFISKEKWIQTNHLKNTLKAEKEKVIKSSLELMQLNAEKKFTELFRIDPEVDLDLLKAELTGKVKIDQPEGPTIIEIMDTYNLFFTKRVNSGERAPASLQKYKRAKDLLLDFITSTYKKEDLLASELSSSFVFKLEQYLKYESSFKDQTGIKNNSVVKYMKMYKTACNYAIKMDLIIKNPFNIYDGRLSIKDAVFLTQQELNTIENKIFPTPRLEKVKDIFLFSCYTGYAPVDALELTERNLSEDSTGNLWIMTSRAKTAIRANVPVLPTVEKIISKYKNQQKGLIPKISNQKMNAYLKEIADVCGIDKHLTWYVARHTFATTVTLGNGVRLENVSAMMGHTNTKQTQHYAKVLDVNIMEDMEKLKSKFK
ncbi:site-specific integrase [Flavobacterium hibernum]|uniref:Tyrosine type site-specific recombinase n=2 Tax=Flavobacterium TaxID=237 RepID=A0A0D0ET37_9FLAO|nr:site-specific integrase [Flavobacterium hibernum]KIO51643.1 tyrosine type site-specific recombinase [Flavobacterium hibernum]OXA85246.1 tyrosine type site-specific recombinase [Flavobacterium hibernum]STO11299.1 site-specific tyrosine recombinase XerC [Flavobacterium hibernum]